MVYSILWDKPCLTCRKYWEIEAERKRGRERESAREGKREREVVLST